MNYRIRTIAATALLAGTIRRDGRSARRFVLADRRVRLAFRIAP